MYNYIYRMYYSRVCMQRKKYSWYPVQQRIRSQIMRHAPNKIYVVIFPLAIFLHSPRNRIKSCDFHGNHD